MDIGKIKFTADTHEMAAMSQKTISGLEIWTGDKLQTVTLDGIGVKGNTLKGNYLRLPANAIDDVIAALQNAKNHLSPIKADDFVYSSEAGFIGKVTVVDKDNFTVASATGQLSNYSNENQPLSKLIRPLAIPFIADVNDGRIGGWWMRVDPDNFPLQEAIRSFSKFSHAFYEDSWKNNEIVVINRSGGFHTRKPEGFDNVKVVFGRNFNFPPIS